MPPQDKLDAQSPTLESQSVAEVADLEQHQSPSNSLQQADPIGLEHLILAGGRIGTSPSRPSPLSMPSFAWKLSDQVADVSTYIRNSWGNQATAVSVSDIRDARKRLNLRTPHLTANSGNQN
jgi:mono/diheme cytochrome c family protein